MTRPAQIQVPNTCDHCGTEIASSGGFALACSPGTGKSARIPLPAPRFCNDPACRKERNDQAIATAIETGLIDP